MSIHDMYCYFSITQCRRRAITHFAPYTRCFSSKQDLAPPNYKPVQWWEMKTTFRTKDGISLESADLQTQCYSVMVNFSPFLPFQLQLQGIWTALWQNLEENEGKHQILHAEEKTINGIKSCWEMKQTALSLTRSLQVQPSAGSIPYTATVPNNQFHSRLFCIFSTIISFLRKSWRQVSSLFTISESCLKKEHIKKEYITVSFKEEGSPSSLKDSFTINETQLFLTRKKRGPDYCGPGWCGSCCSCH